MPRWNKFKKKLIKEYEPDIEAEINNKSNENILVKEINKIIKKTKTKPISTHNLLK